MSSHTPGPYCVEFHPQRDCENSPDYNSIEAGILGRNGVIGDTLNRDCTIDPDTDRCNALLFAATTDLLALAERVVQIFRPMQDKGQNGQTFEQLLERAEKVIAKAKGIQ